MVKRLIVLSGLIVVLVGAVSKPLLESKITDIPTNRLSEEKPGPYRLPKNTIPQGYSVWLRTWIDEGKSDYQGRVTIRLIALESNTRNITIHKGSSIIVKNVTLLKVTGSPIETIPTDPFTYNEIFEFLTIPIQSEEGLLLEETYELTIHFLGKHDGLSGFYKTSYKIDNRTVWYATTHFEPTDARAAFPCYDEPALRAKFDFGITHNASYRAIFNMPAKEIRPLANSNHVTTLFKKTVKMSTYQLAFVVSNYVFREDARPKTLHRVYARQSFIEDAAFALEAGPKMLEGLEKYLDVPYSLPKMDQIGIIELNAGAMENWGLVTYREEELYFNAQTFGTKKKIRISSIMAHEFAHQWFGNIITPKWWSCVWLNEGFASVYQWEIPQMVYPENRFGELFTVEALQKVFEIDHFDKIQPMTFYLESPGNIRLYLFSDISYLKAGSVLRMTKHFLTENIWKDGLKRYFEAKKFDAADPDDLFAGLDAAVSANGSAPLPNGVTVKKILDSWHLQGGYPLVQVNRIYGGSNVLTIRQKQYIFDAPNHNSTTTWWIPISLSSRDKPDPNNTIPNIWLPQETVEANFSRPKESSYTDADWILINKQQTGYYRVNYDERNWKMLAKELVHGDLSKIHLSSRAQLLDDALDLARHEFLDYYSALSIVHYLRRETDYLPWAAAIPGITWLRPLLINSETTGRFRYFMVEITNAIYAKYRAKNSLCDTYFDQMARSVGITWACLSGNTLCRSDTKTEVRKALATGQDIEPDLRRATYCAGMRDANREEFNALRAKFEVSSKNRNMYIYALSCNENAAILRDFLTEIFSNTTKSSVSSFEKLHFFVSMQSTSTTGFAVVLDYFRSNGEIVYDAIGKPNTVREVYRIANVITTTAENKIFEELLANVPIPEMQKELARQVVASNLKWVADNANEVNKFLKEIYGDVAPTTQPSPEPPHPTKGGGKALSVSIILLVISTMFRSFLN